MWSQDQTILFRKKKAMYDLYLNGSYAGRFDTIVDVRGYLARFIDETKGDVEIKRVSKYD